jgi:hypothetical protein
MMTNEIGSQICTMASPAAIKSDFDSSFVRSLDLKILALSS